MVDNVTNFLENKGILNKNDPVGAPRVNLDNDQEEEENQQHQEYEEDEGFPSSVGVMLIFVMTFTVSLFGQSWWIFIAKILLIKAILIVAFSYNANLAFSYDNRFKGGLEWMNRSEQVINKHLFNLSEFVYQYINKKWKNKRS